MTMLPLIRRTIPALFALVTASAAIDADAAQSDRNLRKRELSSTRSEARGDADVTSSRAVSTAGIERRQIQLLEQLITVSEPTDAELPELRLRLVAHLVDARDRLERVGDRFASEAMGARAAGVLAALADDPSFADDPRLPAVLHDLANALRDLGRQSEMLEIDRRLVVEFPDDELTVDALLAFADDHFADGRLADAMLLYQEVAGDARRPELHAYAMWRLARCRVDLLPEDATPPA